MNDTKPVCEHRSLHLNPCGNSGSPMKILTQPHSQRSYHGQSSGPSPLRAAHICDPPPCKGDQEKQETSGTGLPRDKAPVPPWLWGCLPPSLVGAFSAFLLQIRLFSSLCPPLCVFFSLTSILCFCLYLSRAPTLSASVPLCFPLSSFFLLWSLSTFSP